MAVFDKALHTYNPLEGADPRPGDYYVTAWYGNSYTYLVGPFRNDHQAALGMVEAARRLAYTLDAKAPWYAYGTCRREIDDTHPRPGGKLNAELGLEV